MGGSNGHVTECPCCKWFVDFPSSELKINLHMGELRRQSDTHTHTHRTARRRTDWQSQGHWWPCRRAAGAYETGRRGRPSLLGEQQMCSSSVCLSVWSSVSVCRLSGHKKRTSLCATVPLNFINVQSILGSILSISLSLSFALQHLQFTSNPS